MRSFGSGSATLGGGCALPDGAGEGSTFSTLLLLSARGLGQAVSAKAVERSKAPWTRSTGGASLGAPPSGKRCAAFSRRFRASRKICYTRPVSPAKSSNVPASDLLARLVRARGAPEDTGELLSALGVSAAHRSRFLALAPSLFERARERAHAASEATELALAIGVLVALSAVPRDGAERADE